MYGDYRAGQTAHALSALFSVKIERSFASLVVSEDRCGGHCSQQGKPRYVSASFGGIGWALCGEFLEMSLSRSPPCGGLARRCTKQTGKQGRRLSFDSRAPRYPTGDIQLPVTSRMGRPTSPKPAPAPGRGGPGLVICAEA